VTEPSKFTLPFADRLEAGRVLAAHLQPYSHRPDFIVLGLARGGVPVAFEVARQLGLPLDVFVVRKLGVPGQEELAMGALASGGVCLLNHEVIAALGLSDAIVRAAIRREEAELARRERLYRPNDGPRSVRGKGVILVDDGLATGYTMRAAVAAVRQRGPSKVVVAVPVAAVEACNDLASEADDLVCVASPESFEAVGDWYADFSQTQDADVRTLLEWPLLTEDNEARLDQA
jgi:predicted phosphoribosyltransferase